METLELKHLSAYLPYGLCLKTNINGDIIFKLNGVILNDYFKNEYDIKPILRPLSDLNNIICIDSKKIYPYEELYKIRKNVEIYKPINSMSDIEILVNTEDYSHEIDLFDGYLIIQKLLEWHFDVFRLIEKGLAIDKNTL